MGKHQRVAAAPEEDAMAAEGRIILFSDLGFLRRQALAASFDADQYRAIHGVGHGFQTMTKMKSPTQCVLWENPALVAAKEPRLSE
jgi:hypothetical protein